VTDVIHQTPPPVSASKNVIAETATAEATGAEAGTTEDSNLETTLDVIDNILLKMAEEEATVAAVNTAS
jgi:hypothetical protein